MNILVLGSSGFIGSSLCKYFSIDNNVKGADIIMGVHTDFLINNNYVSIESILANNHFDVCINCVGAANVNLSFRKSYFDFSLSTSFVAELLDAIVKNNSNCYLVNISSAAVYGNPRKLPIIESDKLEPISPYGVHKRLGEILLYDYCRIYGLRACSLRIFSAYGEGQKKLFLWDFLQKATKVSDNNYLTLFGTGDESRDYIHVHDIAEQVKLVIHKGRFQGESYNVANGTEVKIRDLANLIMAELPFQKEIVFNGEVKEGDPRNWVANILPLLQMGYNQKISLKDGVRNYVKWYIDDIGL